MSEVTENTTQSLINKVIDNTTSRLKIPIISTYLILLTFHNWDLIYYLLFQNDEATAKIAFIKENYLENYGYRIIITLFYAILILVIFTFIDLVLTILFQGVYLKKKKIFDKVNDYKSIDTLNTLISSQHEEIRKLNQKYQKQLDLNSQHVSVINKLNDDIFNLDIKMNNNVDLIRFSYFMSQIIKIDDEINLLYLKEILLILKNNLIGLNVVYSTDIFINNLLMNKNYKVFLNSVLLLLGNNKYINIKKLGSDNYELSNNNDNIDYLYKIFNID